METAMTAAAAGVKDVNNYWQIIYTAIVVAGVLIALWVWRSTDIKTKENAELIKAKTDAQDLATKMRKAERDKQFDSIKTELTNVKRTAEGVGKALDEHRAYHTAADKKIEEMFERVNSALCTVGKDVTEVKISVAKIETRMEERDKRGVKNES